MCSDSIANTEETWRRIAISCGKWKIRGGGGKHLGGATVGEAKECNNNVSKISTSSLVPPGSGSTVTTSNLNVLTVKNLKAPGGAPVDMYNKSKNSISDGTSSDSDAVPMLTNGVYRDYEFARYELKKLAEMLLRKVLVSSIAVTPLRDK